MNAAVDIMNDAPIGAAGAAIVLGTARLLGFIAIFPLFTLFQVTGVLALGVAFALSLPAIIDLYGAIQAGLVQSPVLYLALVGKEIALGVGYGLLLGLPFWAALHGGAIVDQYRGATTPALFDPTSAIEATAVATLLPVMITFIYLVNDGFFEIVALLWSSFAMWPPLQLWPDLQGLTGEGVGELLNHMIRYGTLMVSAFLVMMAAADLAFVFIARSATQLPIFDLAAVAKTLVVLVLMVATVWFLPHYADDLWSGLQDAVRIRLPEF